MGLAPIPLFHAEQRILQQKLFGSRTKDLVQLPTFFLKFRRHDVQVDQTLISQHGQLDRLADRMRMQAAAEVLERQSLVVHRNQNVAGIKSGTLGGRVRSHAPDSRQIVFRRLELNADVDGRGLKLNLGNQSGLPKIPVVVELFATLNSSSKELIEVGVRHGLHGL